MMPKRRFHKFTVAGLSGALLGLLLAMPVATLAATPSWDNEFSKIEALPPSVETGEAAAYRATIHNAGPSNVSQLFVTASFSEGGTAAYVNLTNNGQSVTCTAAELISTAGCSAGALGAGSSATLVVAYVVTGSSTVSATVAWTSVGTAGDGDNSRGDVLSQTATTAIASGDSTGGFALPTNNDFETNLGVSTANPFATTFKAPENLVPVEINDGVFLAACPVAACFGNANGNAISVDVADGKRYDAPFSITFYASGDVAPKGTNAKNLTVVHYESLDAIDPDLSISNGCPKFQTPVTTCRDVEWDGQSKVFTITVWLFENGFVKFH